MAMAVQIVPTSCEGGVETAARHATRAGVTDLYFIDRAGIWRSAKHASRAPVAIFSLWKSIPVMVLCRLLNPRGRLVAMLHSDRAAHWADALASWLMCRIASEVWADCEAVLKARRWTVGFKPARPVSFALPRLPGKVREPSPRFVYWGRISREKRLDRAVALIAELRSRGVPAELDIFGPGDGARFDGEGVRYRGRIDRAHLPTFTREHAFFLMLSDQEGASMAAMEALQMGLVPILTPVGRMAEYARCGHRYESAGAAADWVESLDGDRYKALSAAAMGWRFADHADSLREAIEKPHVSITPHSLNAAAE